MSDSVSQQYSYPKDLLSYIKNNWHAAAWSRSKPKKLPPSKHILRMLDTAFQASLSSQERRPVRLRIAYCSPISLLRDVELRRRNRPIKFSEPRPFSVSELIQLGPAVDPHQILIGIKAAPKDNKGDDTRLLEIWGLVDAGYSWWEFIRGERVGSLGGSPPPDCLTVSVINTGGLTVCRGGMPIVSLEQGRVVLPMAGVLHSGPIGKYFDDIAREFHADVCQRLHSDRYDPENQDEDWPERFLRKFITRVLLRMRDRRHGGTLLMVPDEWNRSDSRLRDRLSIKYPTTDRGIWPLLVEYISLHRRYHDKLLPAWGENTISGDLFSEIQQLESSYSDTEDLVRDRANQLASLANVDGAIVLTTRMCLLGFGAEVAAQSPTLREVKLAASTCNSAGERCPITDYGTRHRSAMRFCSSHEGVLAFVVSQDGPIRAIKRVGADVVVWSGIEPEYFAC